MARYVVLGQGDAAPVTVKSSAKPEDELHCRPINLASPAPSSCLFVACVPALGSRVGSPTI
jgi:hypothetical protein